MGISRIQYAYERGRILKGIELLVQNKFSYKMLKHMEKGFIWETKY